MIKAVLFDLGGTLHIARHDEALEIANSQMIIDDLKQNGVDLHIDAELLSDYLKISSEVYKKGAEETLIELPSLQIWQQYYLAKFAIPTEKLAPLAEKFSAAYDDNRVRNIVRPNMNETIRKLNQDGYVTGLISNIISTTFIPRVLQDYGVYDDMACIIQSEIEGIRKPDPQIFEIASRQIGIPLSQIAYVGDTLSRDVLGSRNANLPLVI